MELLEFNPALITVFQLPLHLTLNDITEGLTTMELTKGGAFLTHDYWHEVGHSINFFISGLTWRGDFSDRLNSAAGFYAAHAIGSLVVPKYNPVTTITEGGAEFWSAPWYGFDHLRRYQPWWQ